MHAGRLDVMASDNKAIRVTLDKRHVALRHGMTWWLYRLSPTGWFEQLEQWSGPARTIQSKLDKHGIEPSRAAEAVIATLSERTSFKADAVDETDKAS